MQHTFLHTCYICQLSRATYARDTWIHRSPYTLYAFHMKYVRAPTCTYVAPPLHVSPCCQLSNVDTPEDVMMCGLPHAKYLSAQVEWPHTGCTHSSPTHKHTHTHPRGILTMQFAFYSILIRMYTVSPHRKAYTKHPTNQNCTESHQS